MKNKNTAAILAFLGGIIGLHKFYLRDTGAGVMYLFLFFIISKVISFPLTFILGIIDAINLLGMSQEKFDRKYNKNVTQFQQRRTTRRNSTRSSSRNNRQYQTREDVARQRRNATQKSYQVNRPQKRKRSNPFKKTAFAKFKDYDLEESIVDYKQALEISPEDKEIHFYMAAVYSMMEEKEKSFYHYDKSVQYGLKQTGKILEMDEFAYLRVQPEFEAFKNNNFRLNANQEQINTPDESLVMDDLLLARLNKLKEMRERGLLSENEFLAEKQKIIRR